MLQHVADALAPQCARLVVAGRQWPGCESLDDRPQAGLGPLGGLCAALHYAGRHGYADVIAAPCDLLSLPPDAATRLGTGPAVAQGQWLLGLWPASLAATLSDFLQSEQTYAVQAFVAAAGAREVPIPGLRNVNRPEDMPPA